MRVTKNYRSVASALLVVAGGVMLGIMFDAHRSRAQDPLGGPSVHVVNTSSAPAIASLIDEPGRIPYFSSQTA